MNDIGFVASRFHTVFRAGFEFVCQANFKQVVCRLFLSMVAGSFFVSAGLASDSDADADGEEYEGKTMTLELEKPTWSDGATYDERVRYSYSVNDITARYGEDHYVQGGRRTGKIVFPQGQNSTVEFKVTLVSDSIDEGDGEKFRLVLSNPQYEVVPNTYLYGFNLPAEIKYTGLILEND